MATWVLASIRGWGWVTVDLDPLESITSFERYLDCNIYSTFKPLQPEEDPSNQPSSAIPQARPTGSTLSGLPQRMLLPTTSIDPGRTTRSVPLQGPSTVTRHKFSRCSRLPLLSNFDENLANQSHAVADLDLRPKDIPARSYAS